jgi:SAM-dependent methyltransferase
LNVQVEFDQTYFASQYRDYQKQNPARKLAFYRTLAESAAGERPHTRILDVGCAFGLFLSQLDKGWQRFGMDDSAYAIEKARERDSSVEFAVSASGEIPFAGPFDVITAFDVLEHINELERMISLIRSRLAPGGGFVFVVPVYDGPTGPIIRALDKDPTHVHKQGRGFWLTLQGFELKDWWGIYRYLLPGAYYCHVVTHSLRRYTPAIACWMQRR